MNPGLALFKKRRRFQGGTGDVRYTPVSPTEDYPFTTDEEFIKGRYPHETQGDEQGQMATPQQRESSYGTIGVQINGKEVEVPVWNKGMTPGEAEDAARMRLEWGLSPFATDAELEAKQNAAHKGPDDASALPNHYAKGTSNTMNAPNPGLQLFKRMTAMKKGPQLPQFPPKGFAKGSSGIHIDPANKGKFTALQKQTGKSTAELKNSPNPLTRKRANFAMMAKRHFKPLTR